MPLVFGGIGERMCTSCDGDMFHLAVEPLFPWNADFFVHCAKTSRWSSSLRRALFHHCDWSLFIVACSEGQRCYISRYMEVVDIVVVFIITWDHFGFSSSASPPMLFCGGAVWGRLLLSIFSSAVLFYDLDPASWFKIVSLSLICPAAACLATWFIWISPGFSNRDQWTDWTTAFNSLVEHGQISWKMAFVSWMAPLGIGLELGLAALLCWMRRQHNLLHDGDGVSNNTWIVSAVKQLSVWIGALLLLGWLNAALTATWESQFDQGREDLRDEVLSLGVSVFMVVFVWTVDTLGPKEVEAASRASKAVQETKAMIHGDWGKGAFLLMTALPMCACGIIDALEKFLGVQREQPLLWFLAHWSWTSVLVKASWLGLGYISVFVGFAKFTSVLLALVNEYLAGWPVYSVSVALFAIGFGLFMLPASPGAPIYVVMGVITTSSAMNNGWTFWHGVALSTLNAFMMKMAFTYSARTFIGKPLSTNLTVRRFCELHTPYMRAVESILKKEGLNLAKVTLLVGGPDWPIAVLCGMLRLPVFQVLLGTAPVLIQSVFPCILAGSLMLVGDKRKNLGVAEVTLAVAGVIQAGSAAIALFFVQDTLEREYEELAKPRPEDEILIELEKKERERSRYFWKEMSWDLLPLGIKLILCFSFVCIETSVILVTGPWEKLVGLSCFRAFGLRSSVSADLGGNPFAIVLPLGWAALSFALISTACLMCFYAYAGSRASKDPRESQSLTYDSQLAF